MIIKTLLLAFLVLNSGMTFADFDQDIKDSQQTTYQYQQMMQMQKQTEIMQQQLQQQQQIARQQIAQQNSRPYYQMQDGY